MIKFLRFGKLPNEKLIGYLCNTYIENIFMERDQYSSLPWLGTE